MPVIIPHSFCIYIFIFLCSFIPIVGHAFSYFAFCCLARVSCSIYWSFLLIGLEIFAFIGEVDETLAMFIMICALVWIHIIYLIYISLENKDYILDIESTREAYNNDPLRRKATDPAVPANTGAGGFATGQQQQASCNNAHRQNGANQQMSYIAGMRF
jgi:hypothetical protein